MMYIIIEKDKEVSLNTIYFISTCKKAVLKFLKDRKEKEFTVLECNEIKICDLLPMQI